MGVRILLIAVLGGGLAACSADQQPQQASDVLILELGGPHKPLRRTLRLEDPKRRLRVEKSEPARTSSAELPTRSPRSARSASLGKPEPPRFREVELRSGQSLYELCRLHLNDPSRWREVMQLNGIAEEDVSRIPAGRMIRIPAR